MNSAIVVTGTDTGIGKTIFSAALVDALGASYWKPVQAGLEEETDTELVTRLALLSPERRIAEKFKLKTPASPHYAARIDGVEIHMDALDIPSTTGPLIIEGAGGLVVPINETECFADVFARWQRPVVLCARTALGTINHTLLSLEALRARAIPVLGVAFIGEEMAESQRIIAAMGKVKILGRLPMLEHLGNAALKEAFAANFHRSDFLEG